MFGCLVSRRSSAAKEPTQILVDDEPASKLHDFKKGDRVEVWSNHQQEWIKNGVIEEAPMTKCVIDGFEVLPGTLKVNSSAGTKWIPADKIKDSIRKAPPGGAKSPGPTKAPPTPGGIYGEEEVIEAPFGGTLCKNGCGRPVQPGLTRFMKQYDTCCRRCASGRERHDKNCGGTIPVMSLKVSKSVELKNPKQWFVEVLDTHGGLATYADSVFARASGGSDVLTKDQLRPAISNYLLGPIGGTLRVKDNVLNQYMKKFSGDKGDTMNNRGFRKLCQFTLEGRRKEWFPQRLPAKTHTFVRKNPNPVNNVYKFGKELGKGSFGTVHAVVHKISGEKRVCKTIQKQKGRDGMTMEEIISEIETMAKLDHPNVIKVYEYFEDSECVMQMMEQCTGGELQDQIDGVFRKGKPMYGETFICDVMKQTLRALAFMHGEKFMHKDLKPQNIMLVEDKSSATMCSIKIIDFGLAELFEGDRKVSNAFGGTLLFMAPEVLKGKFSMKADVWSTGVILYNLITGSYPFIGTWPLPRGKSMEWWEAECKRKIQNDPVPPITSTAVSAECKDLIRSMLEKDANNRPDAAECLEHKWFEQFHDTPQKLSVGITQCLDAYSGQPQLKQAIFLLIAHLWSAPALQELRMLFTQFDVENKGGIPLDALYDVLQKSGMQVIQAVKILHALDNDDSGSISWTEFIAAALCVAMSSNEKLVDTAFGVLDRDLDGKIDITDFEEVFAIGDITDLWKNQLQSECLKIAPEGPYTKAQFAKYIGTKMQVAAGDAFLAVAA